MQALTLYTITSSVLAVQTLSSQWTLNTSGFENCIIHFIDSDCGKSQKTLDIFDEILNSNQNNQNQLTIQSLALPTKPDTPLKSNLYFREMCSVAIIVQTMLCYRFGIRLLGSRVYDVKTSVFFIYEISANCGVSTRPDVDFNYYDRPVIADLHFFYISNKDIHKIQLAIYFCSTCSSDFRYSVMHMTSPHVNLSQIKKYAFNRRMKSMLPLIAVTGEDSDLNIDYEITKKCGFLHSQRKAKIYNKVACDENRIAITNIAIKLNLSISWIHRRIAAEYNYFLPHAPQHYTAAVIFSTFYWYSWRPDIPPEFLFQQLIHAENTNHFVYCAFSAELESFSFLFWTNPLDIWSWIFLGISSFLLAVLLKGNMFEIYAILMRQECLILKKYKFLIIFMLASIVITCGYEGIISSFLTVPPPLVVFNTLKELIANNYKIIGYADNVQIFELESVFKGENITYHRNLTPSLVQNTYYMSESEHLLMLSQCNVTRSFGVSSMSPWKFDMKKQFPDIACHHAKNTVLKSKFIHTFAGYSHLHLFKAFNRIKASGITLFFRNFIAYYKKYATNREIELQEYNLRKPLAFELGDWKLLSVFCLWAGFASFAFLVFLLECFWRFPVYSTLFNLICRFFLIAQKYCCKL